MKLVTWFRDQRLFSKLILVMTVSIVSVCVLTSLITIRMSERLFIETFSITNGKVLRQINTGMDSFHDSIINTVIAAGQSGALKSYLTGQELDSISMSKVYYRMTEQMKQLTSNLNAYDVSVMVTGHNGRSYATVSSYWPVEVSELVEDPLTKHAEDHPRRQVYRSDIREVDGEMVHYIVGAKALLEPTSNHIYGMIYIAVREDVFRQFYTAFTSIGNDIVVLDAHGVVVSSNRPDLIDRQLPELLRQSQAIAEQQMDYDYGTVLDEERVILSHYLPAYDLYLVNLIDRQYTVSQIVDVRSIMLICITIIAAALFVVSLISGRLTRSLTRLVRQMSTVAQKDFSNYIRISGSYEVRELSKAFNLMLDELNDYIRKLIATQQDQRSAELAALQHQINPHFLYNTLASIKMLVQQGSKDIAAETINALISLLQNTISNVSETITIEQEMTNMKNYVFINHVRYGERIKVHYFVAPDTMQCKVPKLIIQPFIENAFFHAFNVKQDGTVYIMVSRQAGRLVCEVVDNGDGMDVTEVTEVHDRRSGSKSQRQLFTGIGIANVDNRIKLLYGEWYGVQIESQLGAGTKVSVVLPVIEEKDEGVS